MNGAKSQLMIVTEKKETRDISIMAAGKQISHQPTIKILGITLSENMKYNEHIWEGKASMVRAVQKKAGLLKNIQPHVSKKTLAKIGDSLVNSQILYGATIWSQTTANNLDALQKAQTKVARMISGNDRRGKGAQRVHRQDMFTNLGWKNVRQLVSTANLNMVKQAMEGCSSEGVNNLFRVSAPIHQRGLQTNRVDHNGPVNRKSTSFDVRSAEEYNQLPDSLKDPTLSKWRFKNHLKDHILTLHHLPRHE